MKIRNSKIQKVDVYCAFPGPKTTINIKTISAFGEWNFTLVMPNKPDMFQLRALLDFSNVKRTDEMEGRIIREVVCGNEIIGYGDPIVDKFFLFNNKENFVTEKDFKL